MVSICYCKNNLCGGLTIFKSGLTCNVLTGHILQAGTANQNRFSFVIFYWETQCTLNFRASIFSLFLDCLRIPARTFGIVLLLLIGHLPPSPGGPLTTATTGLSSSAWPGTAQALTGRKKKKISPCKFYKQNMYIKGFFQKNSPPIPQVSFSLKYLHNTYFFMKTLLIFPVLHRRSDGRGGVNGGRIRSLQGGRAQHQALFREECLMTSPQV